MNTQSTNYKRKLGFIKHDFYELISSSQISRLRNLTDLLSPWFAFSSAITKLGSIFTINAGNHALHGLSDEPRWTKLNRRCVNTNLRQLSVEQTDMCVCVRRPCAQQLHVTIRGSDEWVDGSYNNVNSFSNENCWVFVESEETIFVNKYFGIIFSYFKISLGRLDWSCQSLGAFCTL